jgi:hypothetical protein
MKTAFIAFLMVDACVAASLAGGAVGTRVPPHMHDEGVPPMPARDYAPTPIVRMNATAERARVVVQPAVEDEDEDDDDGPCWAVDGGCYNNEVFLASVRKYGEDGRYIYWRKIR